MLKLVTKTEGLSLIEAVLAIGIITIILLFTIQLFPFSLKLSKTGEQSTIAANLAQAKMEEIFSLGYENIGTGTIEAKHRLSNNPENPFYQYQRETQVEYVDGNLNNSSVDTGMKKVTVIIYWKSFTNLEKNLSFKTLISKK